MLDEHWLEVSLIVDGEMAEAVSDVLTRHVSGGVVIESTQITYETNAQGQVAGPLRVCGYLRADENLENAKQSLLEGLWHLGQIREMPPVTFAPVAEVDWTEVWKQHFHPVPIGKHLLIGPTWIEFESESRVEIKLDPGMAFGTGTHPTTQLCLEILEDLLEEQGGRTQDLPSTLLRMIDVGCGSGILGIAAVKFGVRHVLGVDHDADAIAVARQNGALNGVEKFLELSTGSLSEIKSGAYSIMAAPLVTVNILAPVILKMLESGLSDLVESQGYLVLSGILEGQAGEVETAVQRNGMRIQETRQHGDWIAFLVEKLS
jgi:ribosomal protein L11 methyltransferase